MNGSGRLEHQLEIFDKLENDLNEYPDFVQKWFNRARASRLSAKTCKNYLKTIKRYLYSVNSDIKNISISDLTEDSIDSYFISKQTKRIGNKKVTTSDSYQITEWYALNSLFSFLKGKGIEENYVEKISKPSNNDLTRIKKNRIYLTNEDFNSIMQSVENGCGSNKALTWQEKYKNRDMAIMLIFLTTGLRKSAVTEIDIDDISFNSNTLFIKDKGDFYHEYQLTYKTINYIKAWIKEREKMNVNTNALFISRNGNRMAESSIDKLVDKYCTDALGTHISPHKLRGGFCSVMYKQTGDIEKVRRMVGHSQIQTTQRYIVTDGKEKHEACKIMENLLG